MTDVDEQPDVNVLLAQKVKRVISAVGALLVAFLGVFAEAWGHQRRRPRRLDREAPGTIAI